MSHAFRKGERNAAAPCVPAHPFRLLFRPAGVCGSGARVRAGLVRFYFGSGNGSGAPVGSG